MPPSRQQPRGDMFLDSLSEACVNVSSYASICSETKVLDTYTTRHLSKQIKMFRVSFVFEMCFFFCLFFFAQNKLVRKSLNCIYSVLAEVYLKSAVWYKKFTTSLYSSLRLKLSTGTFLKGAIGTRYCIYSAVLGAQTTEGVLALTPEL